MSLKYLGKYFDYLPHQWLCGAGVCMVRSPNWGTNAGDGLGSLDAPAEYHNTIQYNPIQSNIIYITYTLSIWMLQRIKVVASFIPLQSQSRLETKTKTTDFYNIWKQMFRPQHCWVNNALFPPPMCAIYIRKAATWIFPDNQNKWPDSDTEWIGLDRGYSVFVVLNISKVVNWIELDWLQQCLSSGKVFYSANLPLQLFGPLWIPAFSVKLIDLIHWTEECVCVWLYVALNLYLFLHICIYAYMY